VGLDTSCAVLIVLDGGRVTLVDPSQGPFDGVEDTLIGVQNNSSQPVSSLPLTGVGIFGFDADGLCTALPQPVGCPYGPTTYEGRGSSTSIASTAPGGGVTFTITNADTGTVNFSPGIPPGGSAYFSLEGPTSSIAPVEQPISAQGRSFSAAEGQQFNGTVATFTDPDTASTASEYNATIAWGDGSSSAGTISGSGGNFTVSGGHTYAEEGTHRVTVTITDVDTPSNTATANSTANVADAALAANPACPATSIQSFNGTTAKFTDAASPFGTLSDFSATITWGDGSSSTGTVSGPDGGPYTVSGSHTYASTGTFTITTNIKDVGGSSALTSCKTLVFAFAPGGGSFVIGDKNALVGNSVEFWGAQWAKDNQLSGGPAPDSFKGFAESPKAPSCGADWSTDTGNSTPPPPGSLPAFMGVIVTSKASQSGSTDSGNIVHIVVVQTNPGYQPDPGHPGTGKVVAIVC
jgi:hypothetical protein